MAGRRGSEKRRMGDQVLVRLPPVTAEVVGQQAAAEGLSKAAWVRSVIIQHVIDLPSEEARPVPARRRVLPPEDVVEMSRMSAWLNRHNGALVQVAAALREGGHIAAHDHAERVLADVEETAGRLRKLSRQIEADWGAAGK